MPRHSPNDTPEAQSDLARMRQAVSAATRRLNRLKHDLFMFEARADECRQAIKAAEANVATTRAVLNHARDYGAAHARRIEAQGKLENWNDE